MQPNTIHSKKEFAKLTSPPLDKICNKLRRTSQKGLKSMNHNPKRSRSLRGKKIKLSKSITPIVLTAVIAISLLSIYLEMNIISAQTSSSTVVSTELINFYGMTSTEVQTYLQIIDNQGIPMLVVRLNAMSEFQSGSSPGINKAKQVIQEANSRGIQVAVDLHTWYTTWDNYFRDSASNNNAHRSQYITYVRKVLNSFAGSNVYAFMVMNEPQARTATISENQFILDVVNAAKQETNKPISIRFMAGYSPSTGHYSPQIDQACDFLCRNTYWDPRSPSQTVYGTTEAKLNTAINTAHSQGKGLWITEFGKTKNNLESQRAYVEAFVSWSKSKGVDAIFCWVSQPEGGSGEAYNIFNGYTPNPAFYELVNDGGLPTPTPTPTPSTLPTPPPTPSPTPSPSPTPTPTTSTTLIQDGFEVGTFNAWASTRSTSGETATIVANTAYAGIYSAQFTANGQGGYEQTYAYETLTPALDEIYTRGYFRLTLNGMEEGSDRIKLIELRAGSRIIAAAGIRQNGNDLYWWMESRNGGTYVENYNLPVAIDVSEWFSLELKWQRHASAGGGALWINGVQVYEVNNGDTDNYGSCTQVRVGLAEAYNCAPTTVYLDSAAISTAYIGPLQVTVPSPSPSPSPTPSATPTPAPTTPTPDPANDGGSQWSRTSYTRYIIDRRYRR
jgi:aryl-phospho-beta-D-glucosidase BglC (GH1 family)